MDYLEVKCKFNVEHRDLVIAILSNMGFDSFIETNDGAYGYVFPADFNEEEVSEALSKLNIGQFSLSADKLPDINWNKEWETNYEPVEVEDKLYIRASFHEPKPHFPLEIVITPQMSFGTGHHSTTWLMSKALLGLELKGKRVIDIGCGTGILAILAKKLGAIEVYGNDIENWAHENSIENANQNNTEIVFQKGTIDEISLPNQKFDVVLVNINKNILLQEIQNYIDILQVGGHLLLSGFYQSDVEQLSSEAQRLGLAELSVNVKNNWACASYIKRG